MVRVTRNPLSFDECSAQLIYSVIPHRSMGNRAVIHIRRELEYGILSLRMFETDLDVICRGHDESGKVIPETVL